MHSQKIALIGYGKMGKMIESLSIQNGFEVGAIKNSKAGFKNREILECDAIIDFSHPKAILENINDAIHYKKNIVIGTTGWEDQLTEIKQLVDKSNIGLIYSPNFSIGVLLFCKIISHASSLMQYFDEYDVGGFESHHKDKIDIPSGTAKALGKILLNHFKKKEKIIYGNEPYIKNGIHFPSLRSGNDPGMHTIKFDSQFDQITLTHSAKNRESFALGALKAVKWLNNKKGFFTLDDLLEEILDGKTQQ